MKTCPTCGQTVDDGFIEYFCKCGCGIGCKTTDPDAEKKIADWKAKHECKTNVRGKLN